MSTVALFVHTGRDDAIDIARQVADWLTERGHRSLAASTDRAALGEECCHSDDSGESVRLVLSIGGDGTMLRASQRAVAAGADIFGINMGRLGYLAEVEPEGWESALTRYFAGDFQVTERLLVAAECWAPGQDRNLTGRRLTSGLNEVVIEKQANGRTIMLAVSIDGTPFTTYMADGAIIATPTGSTAYSLSARGPIVAPDHRALLLTAVSPHSLFDRSLVLEPSSTIELTLVGDRDAGLSVDGEHLVDLEPGATVRVTADDRLARFVTFGDRNFHQILKAKFGLNDR